MNLIRFYENVNLCSVTTRFISYDLRLVAVAIWQWSLHKKWNFQLKISSVNVAKSAGNCRFGQIYWRSP